MSVELYLDDFVFQPYIWRYDLPEGEWYYGIAHARVLHFLWLALEVAW